MAFTNIPNGNLQVGAPLRSVDILALRDNIPAVMNGDTGAPKIKAAAFEGQSGAAPVFAARAWVSITGSNGNIKASGNVSSVTRFVAGSYQINFSTPMLDANYNAVGSCSGHTGSARARNNHVVFDNDSAGNLEARTTSKIRATTFDAVNSQNNDVLNVDVSIFR